MNLHTLEALQARIATLEARVAALEGTPTKSPKTKGRSVAAECEAAAAVPVPLLLQHIAFFKVWKEFCEHRCKLATVGTLNKKKFPWTARAAKRLLNTCEEMGEEDAIEALNLSMDKEWADIYPPDRPNGKEHSRHNPL